MKKEVLADGRAELYLGDCLEILPSIAHIESVITDPPYGLGYKYLSWPDELEPTRALVRSMIKIVREQSDRIVIFPGVHNVQSYPQADWICSWSWRSTSHFGKCGYSMWQPLLIYGNDLPGFGNVNGITKMDSIHFPDGVGIGFLGESVKHHPCPKPLKIMNWLVRRFSENVVLDPFMGSGTTGVACMNQNRKFIGIEIEPKYFDIACERIAAASRQGQLFEDNG